MIPSTMSSRTERVPVLMNDSDAMNNILIRLPLKSLLQCKSVCKWWYDLISHPVFVSAYSRQNPQYYVSGFYLQKYLYLQLNSELEFLPYEGEPDAAPKPSLSFIEDDKGVYIRHSCNGLLLCGSFRCNEEDRQYYISKPTTKQYFPLPKPPCQTVFGISIAYNPSKSPYYKLICICESKLSTNSNGREMKIYSSATGSWRDSANPPIILDDMFLFERGVYWNGSLHWVGRGESSLRYDVEEELLLTMPMPPMKEGRTERRLEYFGESGGSLYLIEINGPSTYIFDVMEMKSDYSGWSVKYHVDLGIMNLHLFHHRYSVLHIVHHQVEEDDESFMVIRIPGDFRFYYLRDHTFTRLCSSTFPVKKMGEQMGLWYNWEGVYPYTNPLCYL